ncbi:MAG: hypothetical protein N3A01_02845 [Bacteroidales bacterium]|nr:hypothetical protein [Bacteroidales bacterium]
MYSELSKKILNCLPFCEPFLFIDKITYVDDKKIIGEFFYRKDLFFYKGHFKNKPITPATIQIETMGQIGVAHGIYLLNIHTTNKKFDVYAVTIESEHNKIILPETHVFIESNLIFFRLNYLKCKCLIKNSENQILAHSIYLLKFIIYD